MTLKIYAFQGFGQLKVNVLSLKKRFLYVARWVSFFIDSKNKVSSILRGPTLYTFVLKINHVVRFMSKL